MPTLVVHTGRGCAWDEFDQSYVRFNLSLSHEIFQPAIAKWEAKFDTITIVIFPFLPRNVEKAFNPKDLEAYQSRREANLF